MMLPLKNKRVLITRPKDKVASFAQKLKKLGAEPIALPLIQLTSINQKTLLNTYQSQDFDWLIFTSYNAVYAFFEVVEASSIRSKIAVVGPKTKEALNQSYKGDVFLPSIYTAEALVNEIPVEVNETVLLPQSAIAKDDVEVRLKERGVIVTSVKSYENKKVTYTAHELVTLFSQEIDYITFTSGSTVKSFMDLEVDMGNAKVVCIGPSTAEVAQQLGVKVDAVAYPHTEEGIIETIIDLEKNPLTDIN